MPGNLIEVVGTATELFPDFKIDLRDSRGFRCELPVNGACAHIHGQVIVTGFGFDVLVFLVSQEDRDSVFALLIFRLWRWSTLLLVFGLAHDFCSCFGRLLLPMNEVREGQVDRAKRREKLTSVS